MNSAHILLYTSVKEEGGEKKKVVVVVVVRGGGGVVVVGGGFSCATASIFSSPVKAATLAYNGAF